jgi:hypothetical protein
MADRQHVVMLSGGITSWAAARRVADQHGTDHLTLLFADTLVEDPDLYRFLRDCERDLHVPVTRVADGRTPAQVDADRRWLSNSRTAQCSLELKIKPCRAWLTKHTDPADTTIYVGIEWTSSDAGRLPAIRKGWQPWPVEAPLLDPPYIGKEGWIAEARRRGITEPRLYALGFEHNNCGGACVRGGQAQWAHLLRVFPDRFAAAEAHEQRMRSTLGANVSILRDRTGGTTAPLTLTALRHRIETDPQVAIGGLDWGGCGCFAGSPEPAPAGGEEPSDG